MGVTYRGKRVNFDNIAPGSATGVERTVAGGGGERTSSPKPENFRSVCNSSYTSPRGYEHLRRTVCSDVTTARTTDRDPKE